ncbi:MAG: hypothetical protein SFY56_05925 [Bacteroidota bacterium]|nr:hypothetical protein [Bacteroidota bacterium]
MVLFFVTGYLLVMPDDIKNSNDAFIKKNELFFPEFKRLNCINNTVIYTDSIYSTLKIEGLDTAVYAGILSEVLKKRFYHGIANYSLSENWIAYLMAKLSWSHFSVIVDANDILKHSEGLCSQQNIVFIAALNKKGIVNRTVGLGNKEGPGHFLIEINYNSCWHLYDIDLEPNWSKIDSKHESMSYLLSNKEELYKIYSDRINRKLLDKIIVKVSYGLPNKLPAKKMLLFHKITKIFTYVLPFIFLLLFVFSIKNVIKK